MTVHASYAIWPRDLEGMGLVHERAGCGVDGFHEGVDGAPKCFEFAKALAIVVEIGAACGGEHR